MLLTFAGYWPQIVQGLWQGRGLLSLLMTTRPWKKPGWLSTIVLLCALLLSVLIHMRSAQPWAQMIIFISKSYFFVFMMMWIRWSVPRYRVDQLMDLCWKKFVPLNFVCILATSIWMVLRG
jgi:NADH:ubiquinone oxidoreductase subunit H